MKPAVAVLSTGSVSFPLNRPVCALYAARVSMSFTSVTIEILSTGKL